ncbi:uncharacterized protein TRIREDRAFT_105880 [Trichoderma reesei QM6a]|uniref:Predicted protein n=2 Tax=Hypocrea jecorina TaxID=51453 RepID=G0RFJ5_HYPJQ|nr:uncharacterized protein TRIREDRAFT_105880 [Trichoderma reesei QM6a]EGR49733.1 predicted protein [Trichoderma reesei QM6a]ETS03260.1 hypothetical protein M419DRAFT_75915 [Trichoderma reesei RUT C-30]
MQPDPSKDATPDANPAHLRRRACIPCTRAKRRCDMNRPSCERCLDKEVACRYSATRPYARRAAKSPQTNSPGSNRCEESHATPLLDSSLLASQDAEDCNDTSCGRSYSKAADGITILPYSTVSWFLQAEHWVIYHGDVQSPQLPAIRGSVLQQYFPRVRKWLMQWIELDHCPMIHRSLFAETGMPPCVQDAYAAMALYAMKNENNEETVMQHIRDKVDSLVQRYSDAEQALLVGGFASVSPLSTIQHLSRVLSLLIYVFIGLYDGHIRQRAEAEKLIPLLRDWTAQLWNSVNVDVTLQNAFGGDYLVARDNTEAVVKLWRIWILMENVRRVWMVSTCTTCIYLVARDGTGHCDGTIDFTARRGLWDAASAPLWKNMLERKDPLFVVPFQTAWLFEKTTVEDIDPFGLTMMSLTLNSDKLDSWIAESTDTHLEALLMTV